MKILPKKRVRVSEGLYVWISNHFTYSDFGVRDSGEMRYYGRRYINLGSPGTGFIERESESHSYHEFVRDAIAKQKPSYWKMVTGREPDFKREIAAVEQALEGAEGLRRRILDAYLNALRIHRTEERMERIVRGIKDKIGHHSNKYLVSVMSHFKNKIAQLSHDMDSVEVHVSSLCSPEQYAAYLEMVEAFTHVASCRRVWHYNEAKRAKYNSVFFDLGIFDFIRSESYLPLMRDSHGTLYYLLPQEMLVVRSSVDFDVVPYSSLSIVSQELAVEEPIEMLSSRLGDAASMIRIPELDLTFYFNHVRAVLLFEEAWNRLKECQA